jgi:hypothetical protein
MNSGDRLCLVLSCLVRYPLLYLCHLHFGTAIPSEKNSFFISYSPNFDRSKCVYTQVSVGCTSFSGFSYRNTVRLEGIGGSIERGELAKLHSCAWPSPIHCASPYDSKWNLAGASGWRQETNLGIKRTVGFQIGWKNCLTVVLLFCCARPNPDPVVASDITSAVSRIIQTVQPIVTM